MQENARPDVATVIPNMDDYDVAIVSYPIWHGTCPRVILNFLEAYDLSGKTIVSFATSGGSGFGKAMDKLHFSVSDSIIWKEGKLQNDRQTNEALVAWAERL